jgi:P27 family predicted phage terminase small subunit
MARRPKSAAAKKRAGNPGKREITANPEPAAADPNAPPAWLQPEWFPRAGEAVEQWKAIIPEMSKLRLFTIFDVNMFSRYCLFMAMWLQALSEVKLSGMTTAGKTGQEKSKPYMQLVEISKELRAMESEFGGSPNSRRKINAPESAAPGAEEAFEQEFGAALAGKK